jgi:hypothetical protein
MHLMDLLELIAILSWLYILREFSILIYEKIRKDK